MGGNGSHHQLIPRNPAKDLLTFSNDLCFMAEPYNRFGAVSNSMVAVTLLQALYTVDFFVNKAW